MFLIAKNGVGKKVMDNLDKFLFVTFKKEENCYTFKWTFNGRQFGTLSVNTNESSKIDESSIVFNTADSSPYKFKEVITCKNDPTIVALCDFVLQNAQ